MLNVLDRKVISQQQMHQKQQKLTAKTKIIMKVKDQENVIIAPSHQNGVKLHTIAVNK